MQLIRERTPHRFAGWRAAAWRAAALLALLALLSAPVLAQDEEHDSDEAPHHLQGQVLCIDPSSIMVLLDEVDPGRARGAERSLPNRLAAQIASGLRKGHIPFARNGGCGGSDAYVSVVVQVAGLDPAIYTHHGPDSFSIAVSLQVGGFATSSELIDRNVLPDMTFLGFQESVASEARGAAPFESRVGTTTGALVTQLVDAWRADNP